MLGRPRVVGFSLIETAVQPFAASRLSSASVAFMSQVGSRPQGMKRPRSEEHTSELQSPMRISYAVFCSQKKLRHTDATTTPLNSIHQHQSRTPCTTRQPTIAQL